MLLHLGRSGGAVDAEHVGSHRAHRDDRRADLRADQHPAGRLHRHLDLQRHLAPRRLHRPAAGDHRRFDLEQVHARLDDEQIDATLEQPARLDLVGVAEIGEVDVAEARKLCARSDRATDVSGPAVGGVAVGNLAGDPCGGDVQVVGAIGDVVLGEDGGEAAEAGGLDGVDADVEERRVHGGDDVGPREAQHLVAALEGLPAEVVGRQVESLHVRAEGTVEDDDPLGHGIEVRLVRHGVPRLLAHLRRHRGRWDRCDACRGSPNVQNSRTWTSLPARMAPAVVIVSRRTRKCCVTAWTSRRRRCSGQLA